MRDILTVTVCVCVGVCSKMLTFQSSEVTSLLLGTSCPPSRMQCLRTSCVELLVLFSLRFQIRAVESPDLKKTKQIQRKGMTVEMGREALKLVKLCLLWRNIYQLFS